MEFKTNYNRKPEPGEKNSGEKLVESAGYIPADRKIMDMINAGERLQAYRSGYEFNEDEVPDGYYDPTREPNFDMADASELAINTMEKLSTHVEITPETPTATVEEKPLTE